LIGLVAIAALLYLFRGPLLSKPLAGLVARQLSTTLRGTFTIERIEGSWFSDIVVVGLKTEKAPTTGSIREISLKRARVSYGLTDLFTDPIAALRTAEIDGAHCTIDLLAEPDDVDEEPFSLSQLEEILPNSFPNLRVRDSSLRFLRGDETYTVKDLHLEGSGDDLLLRLQGIEVPSTFPAPLPTDLELKLRRTAPLEVELTVTPAIAGLDLRKLTARVQPDDTISGSLEATLFGADLLAKSAQTKLEWSLTRLDIKNLPEWLTSYADSAPLPTSGLVSLSGGWDMKDPDLNLEVKVLSEAVHFHTLTDLNLNADLALKGGRITVRGLGVTAADSRVHAAALTLSPSHPLVVTEAENWDIGIPDVRALLTNLRINTDEIPWPKDAVGVNLRLHKSDDHTIRIEQGRITAGTTEVAVSGTLMPNPQPEKALESLVDLTFDATVPEVKAAMSGVSSVPVEDGSLTLRGTLKGALLAPQASAQVMGKDLLIRGVRTKQISFLARYDQGAVQVEELKASGDWGRIEGLGKAHINDQTLEDVALLLAVDDLRALESVLRENPELGGRVELNVQLDKDAGPWESGYRCVLKGTGSNLVHRGQSLGDATLAVTGAWPLITDARIEVTGPLAEFRAAATGDLTDLKDLALDITKLEGSVPDLSALRTWLPDIEDLTGNVHFAGQVRKSRGMPWMQVMSNMEVRVAGIAGRGLPVVERGEILLSTDGGQLTIKDLNAQGTLGQVQLAGMAVLLDQGGRLELDQLRATFKDYPLSLRAPMKLTWTEEGHIEASDFAVDLLGGTLTGSLQHEGTQQIALKGNGLLLAALPLPEELEGRLDFELTASGDLKRPLADLTLTIADLRARGESGALHLSASQTSDALVLRDLKLTVGAATTLIAKGQLDASLGTDGFQLPDSALTGSEAHLQITAADLPLLHRLGLPAAASLTSLAADLKLNASNWTLEGAVSDPAWNQLAGMETFTSQLRLTASGDPSESRFQVTAVPDRGFTLEGAGTASPGLNLGDPEALVQALLTSALRGTAALTIPDLGRFRPLVPDLRTLEGSLTVDLRTEGTVASPEPSGSVRVKDLELKMGSDLPSLTDGDLTARIVYPRVTIEPFIGQLGYGPFRLTGTADLPVDGSSLHVDFALDGKNLLLARSQHLRVRSDLDLTLKGALEALNIAGTVTLSDVLFSKPIELTASSAPTAPDNGYQLFSFRDPPLSGLQFDVRILADRTIRLSNNLIRGDISSDLHLRGTGSVPKPEGRAFFSDLRVQLPFSRLTVERGDVVFEKNAPFSPRLAVTANTRMRGYDMELQVSGRLPDTRIQISSEPHLTQQDALALLTLGATPSGLQKEGLSRAALTRVGSLMADGILSGLMGESDPDAESIADRVSLEVGRDVSRTGSSTIEFEFELRPELFLRAERDKYDAYNMGAIWRWRFR
jgi:hypothetical protein